MTTEKEHAKVLVLQLPGLPQERDAGDDTQKELEIVELKRASLGCS